MRALLLLALFPLADQLDALLAKGEVSLFETRADGRLAQVTTIADLPAPVGEVWTLLTNFEGWPGWCPQVSEVQVLDRQDEAVEVEWSIDTIGPTMRFRARYTLDRPRWTVRGTWTGGAFQGSHWTWRLEDRGATTRLHRTSFTNAVADNWLLRQFDDRHHTLEYGINAATGFVETRALAAALSR